MHHIILGEPSYLLTYLALELAMDPSVKSVSLILANTESESGTSFTFQDCLGDVAQKQNKLLTEAQFNKVSVYVSTTDDLSNEALVTEKLRASLHFSQNETVSWVLGNGRVPIQFPHPDYAERYFVKRIRGSFDTGSQHDEAQDENSQRIHEFRFVNLLVPIEKYSDLHNSPLNNYIFGVLGFAQEVGRKKLRMVLPDSGYLLFITPKYCIETLMVGESKIELEQGGNPAVYQYRVSARQFVSTIASSLGLSIEFTEGGFSFLTDDERRLADLLINSGLRVNIESAASLDSQMHGYTDNRDYDRDILKYLVKEIERVKGWQKNISADSILFANEKGHSGHLNFAACLLDIARSLDSSKIAIQHGATGLHYSQLPFAVDRCVESLVGLGIDLQGSRVAIVANDSIQFALTVVSLIYMGSTVLIVNPLLQLSSIVDAVESASVDTVLGDRAFLELVAESGDQLPRAFSALACIDDIVSTDNINIDQQVKWAPAYTKPFDFAIGMFTSGTTGRPKLIMHRHQDYMVSAERYAAQVLNLNASDRTLSLSKMSFSFGLHNFLNSLYHGATTIISSPSLAVEEIIEVVKKHQPTIFYAVPTMYQFLLNQEALNKKDFSSIRVYVSAGDRLPVELIRRWQNKIGSPILDSLGSTEAYSTYLTNIPGFDGSFGATGKIVPGFDAKIVNYKGIICSCGEVGTLWLKGPSLPSRYENDLADTAKRFKNGWYCTNDMFTRDKEGFYYYFGRADDVIKVSGQWVSPQEIEDALLCHADVKEVAVIGVGDSETTTRPKAFVVTERQDKDQLVTELKSFAKQKLERWKYPHIIEFVNELPKTVTGKLRRHRLKSCKSQNKKTGIYYAAAD